MKSAVRDLKRLPAHAKEHGDIATAADNEAENAIVATIRAAFPEHAILGEESGHIEGARERAGFKWIVDPLDGAANFAHGYPYFAVSVALAHGTEITHAVVFDPVRDELYAAIRGKGAQLNGTAIRTSSCMTLGKPRIGISRNGIRRWPRTFRIQRLRRMPGRLAACDAARSVAYVAARLDVSGHGFSRGRCRGAHC